MSDKLKLTFEDTQSACASKTDKELKQAFRLFKFMAKPQLSHLASQLGAWALKIGLPIQALIRKTIYRQFVGGESLIETLPTVEQLQNFGIESILDFGVEAKTQEKDFETTAQEILKIIDFANKNAAVATVALKLTGMVRFEVLQKLDAKAPLTQSELNEWERAKHRMENLVKKASVSDVNIWVDAEESWIQDTIDNWTMEMMEKYNKQRAVIFNTIQLYRKDRLEYLKQQFAFSKSRDFILAVKLVRGAYMEKERKRAETFNYPSPIQNSKRETDRDYNEAMKFCIQHDQIHFACASHNSESAYRLAEEMDQKSMARNDARIQFAQLYGMSDNISFNLAKVGFRASKLIPYGPVKEVFPYLVRRAKENRSVTGEVSRELQIIKTELARRKAP